jgi:hypothetical protein
VSGGEGIFASTFAALECLHETIVFVHNLLIAFVYGE